MAGSDAARMSLRQRSAAARRASTRCERRLDLRNAAQSVSRALRKSNPGRKARTKACTRERDIRFGCSLRMGTDEMLLAQSRMLLAV